MARGGSIEVIREDGITKLVNDEGLSRRLLTRMECIITRLLLYNNAVHRDDESLVRSLSRDLTKLLIRHGILNPGVADVKNATARLLFVSAAGPAVAVLVTCNFYIVYPLQSLCVLGYVFAVLQDSRGRDLLYQECRGYEAEGSHRLRR